MWQSRSSRSRHAGLVAVRRSWAVGVGSDFDRRRILRTVQAVGASISRTCHAESRRSTAGQSTFCRHRLLWKWWTGSRGVVRKFWATHGQASDSRHYMIRYGRRVVTCLVVDRNSQAWTGSRCCAWHRRTSYRLLRRGSSHRRQSSRVCRGWRVGSNPIQVGAAVLSC